MGSGTLQTLQRSKEKVLSITWCRTDGCRGYQKTLVHDYELAFLGFVYFFSVE